MISQPLAQKLTFFHFIWKHKYFFLFLILTLPLIISYITTAIQTKNPSYVPIKIGTLVLNSDNLLNEDVNLLKTNPSELIGMENPDSGIYRHFKYYWLFFWNIIYKIFAEISCILIPFAFFYWLFNLINTSSKLKNLVYSIIFGLLTIFLINLLITVVNLATGNISIDFKDANFFIQILEVILLTIPFHGLINLIGYLISLAI